MEPVNVEVCYATAQRQLLLRLQVPPQTRLIDAVRASAITAQCPEIDLARQRLGVYGKLRRGDEPVSEGDRIEIYRDLVHDPKLARRQRAQRARRR